LKLGGWRSKKSGDDIRTKVSDAIRQLEYHRREVETLRRRLEERRVKLFDVIVSAVQKHERDRATVYANEHVEVKKIIRVLVTCELALTQVVLRLESIRDIGDAMKEMGHAFSVIKGVGTVLNGLSTDVMNVQEDIQNTLTETMAELGQVAPTLNIDVNTSSGEEIVEEAMKFLEDEISKSELPEPVTAAPDLSAFDKVRRTALLASGGDESEDFKIDLYGSSSHQPLEDAVSSYINSQGGKLNVYEAAVALNAPLDEVEKAVLKLVNEGRVKISG
jgi:division protein CdvB (Snf7/Vps24/ESCRT-III family)